MTKAGHFTQQHNQKPLFELKKNKTRRLILSHLYQIPLQL